MNKGRQKVRARREKLRAKIMQVLVVYLLDSFNSVKRGSRVCECVQMCDAGYQCLFVCVSVWWCWGWKLGPPT